MGPDQVLVIVVFLSIRNGLPTIQYWRLICLCVKICERQLSVDLSEFIGPLSEAVAAAERWYIESLPLLKVQRPLPSPQPQPSIAHLTFNDCRLQACRVTMKSRAAALAAAAARPPASPTPPANPDPTVGDAMDVDQGEMKEGEGEKKEEGEKKKEEEKKEEEKKEEDDTPKKVHWNMSDGVMG